MAHLKSYRPFKVPTLLAKYLRTSARFLRLRKSSPLHFTPNHREALTFNGRLSAISDAVGTPYWPGVIYIYRSACLSFFGADDVCFSWKPMQTHWGAHRKSGHSSGAITSFMAVLCSRLFMSRLDLRVSTEGSAGQNKADHCTHVET